MAKRIWNIPTELFSEYIKTKDGSEMLALSYCIKAKFGSSCLFDFSPKKVKEIYEGSLVSRPSRARGLKLIQVRGRGGGPRSRPSRARGLKRTSRTWGMACSCVAPFTGAWIETGEVVLKAANPLRRAL